MYEANDFEDEVWEGITTGVMLSMLVMGIVPVILRITAPGVGRVPVLSEGLWPTALNVGAMWLQQTPTGEPQQLWIVSENSTGAFEQVLLGVST